MRIGKEVRIRKMDDYSWPDDLPCLAPGSVGRIVDTFEHPWRSDDRWYYVKFDAKHTYPFYREEICEI